MGYGRSPCQPWPRPCPQQRAPPSSAPVLQSAPNAANTTDLSGPAHGSALSARRSTSAACPAHAPDKPAFTLEFGPAWPIKRSLVGGMQGRQTTCGGDGPQDDPLEASPARRLAKPGGGLRDRSRMAATRNAARGEARKPAGGTPGGAANGELEQAESHDAISQASMSPSIPDTETPILPQVLPASRRMLPIGRLSTAHWIRSLDPVLRTGPQVRAINRPTAGARHAQALARGSQPLQLSPMDTPNRVKAVILLEELKVPGIAGAAAVQLSSPKACP